MSYDLTNFGWSNHFKSSMELVGKDHLKPGRVITDIKNHYRLVTADGDVSARASGRMFYHSSSRSDLPVVGDWVLYRMQNAADEVAQITHILERQSLFVRKIPGRTVKEQPVAANIDTVFLITGLDDNYRLRRIERYLTLAWESGSQPAILLNKMDICPEYEKRMVETTEIAFGVPVHVVSALHNTGLEALDQYLQPGTTSAMLGSSGVGKSTLLNTLAGRDIQLVKDIGITGKGMHTTRTRELFVLPNGAMMIDTPGMRELQLWNIDEGLEEAFVDIEKFAKDCRFSDCAHRSEPGCAVQAAVEAGDLDAKRLDNYQRMQDELASLESRQDTKAILEKKADDRRLAKLIRRTTKNSPKK